MPRAHLLPPAHLLLESGREQGWCGALPGWGPSPPGLSPQRQGPQPHTQDSALCRDRWGDADTGEKPQDREAETGTCPPAWGAWSLGGWGRWEEPLEPRGTQPGTLVWSWARGSSLGWAGKGLWAWARVTCCLASWQPPADTAVLLAPPAPSPRPPALDTFCCPCSLPRATSPQSREDSAGRLSGGLSLPILLQGLCPWEPPPAPSLSGADS